MRHFWQQIHDRKATFLSRPPLRGLALTRFALCTQMTVASRRGASSSLSTHGLHWKLRRGRAMPCYWPHMKAGRYHDLKQRVKAARLELYANSASIFDFGSPATRQGLQPSQPMMGGREARELVGLAEGLLFSSPLPSPTHTELARAYVEIPGKIRRAFRKRHYDDDDDDYT